MEIGKMEKSAIEDVGEKEHKDSILNESEVIPVYDREAILKNAEKCVLQDRNNQYGEPEDVFEDIALLWDSYTKITTWLRDDYKENEFDVCMKQILLKIVRAIHNPAHMDNYVDIAGYAACAGELVAKNLIEDK